VNEKEKRGKWKGGAKEEKEEIREEKEITGQERSKKTRNGNRKPKGNENKGKNQIRKNEKQMEQRMPQRQNKFYSSCFSVQAERNPHRLTGPRRALQFWPLRMFVPEIRL
jgi:hypothetical protein